ncbi:MAG: ABC transporter ATP-binding protein [Erysipelothrix sp.]|nr:ABC transporter ATP-binding protein [Erysipelothrix sp.]
MDLKDLFKKYKKSLALYVLGVVIISGNNLFMNFSMANAFDAFTVDSLSEVMTVFKKSLGLALMPVLLQFISRRLRIGFMTDILKDVRTLAFTNILNMDTESFYSESKETYRSRLISDINLFEKDFFLSLLNIGFALLSTVFSVLLLTYISWPLAVLAVITAIILFVVTKLFEPKVRKKRQESLRSNEVFNRQVSNIIKGATTIAQYFSEKSFMKLFYKDTEDLESVKGDFYLYNKNQNNMSQSIAMLSQTVAFILTTYLLSQGQIKLGTVVLILNSYSQIIWVMISCFDFINRFKSSVDIYNKLVDIDNHIDYGTKPFENGSIVVKDLSFAYGEVDVFSNLNLEIKPKSKVLIYGPSGTGKSTFMNCLSQNLKGYRGDIYYGDTSLRDINHKDFLNHVSYVRQNHFMFDSSIKENIILNQEVDENRFNLVIEQAALRNEFESFDHKLIQNGSNISGGQRQRISIARELYARGDILFLDEPTASLDDDNAKIIYDTILELDKTVICVTHRHLDYLKDRFDQVISFDMNGVIIDA